MRTLRNILPAFICLLLATSLHAQDRQDLLAETVRTPPGRERALHLVEIASRERREGRLKYAVEFAILGSAEAEQHGLETEMAIALLELSRAHHQKGDLESAIAAALKVSRLGTARQDGIHRQAMLQLAELYLETGHAQKALEHLAESGINSNSAKEERIRYLHSQSRAKASVLTPEEVTSYCKETMSEAALLKSDILQLELLSLLASSHARAGRHGDALEHEEQVLELAIRMDKVLETAVAANNIGELNQRLGRMEEALKAFAKGLILVEDIPQLRTSTQMNAALAHARHGNLDAAQRIINEAIWVERKDNNTRAMPKLLRTKAVISQLMGDLVVAQDKALEALRLAEEYDDLQERCDVTALLAGLYEHGDLMSEARSYRKKHRELRTRLEEKQKQEKLAREAQLIRLQRTEREQIDQINKEQQKSVRMSQLSLNAENHEKQLALLIYEKQLEESAHREALLAHDRSLKALALTQAALEAEKQQRLIQELENNRMLQSVDMARMEAERKEKARYTQLLEERALLVETQSRTLEAESRRDRDLKRFYTALAGGFSFAALLLFTAWQSTRRKKRTIWYQNQEIKGINEVLAEKDRNIQSSLRYAQTIQSAILVSEAHLQKLIPESFLFYRPLDKVSGDLPFVKQVGDSIYLAAIDCTGHGVPAAMMTFIAYYGLEQLIADIPDASCGRILDQLHEHVKMMMSARDGIGLYNDGMDICFCRLDRPTGRLTFAGAQLSLFLVRDGIVKRYKGDLKPLGDEQLHPGTGYTEHVIDLQKGDSIFLFSDGIIHQFGGPDGRKKLSLRRLNELLLRSTQMDLREMGECTGELFNSWKGDQPQTDDVLMIGLRYAA